MRHGDDTGIYLDIVYIDGHGQLQIPAEVLQKMGWTEGAYLELHEAEPGRLEIRLVLVH